MFSTYRLYLMKLLRSQSLPPKQLQTVFTALILSRITYAISVWVGHLTNQQRQRINAFLKRARKFGFTVTLYCIEDLLEKSDIRLFSLYVSKKPARCLYPILPGNNKSCQLLLRKRGHTVILPRCTYNLYKNSFVPSLFFRMVYYVFLFYIMFWCVLYVLLCLTYTIS